MSNELQSRLSFMQLGTTQLARLVAVKPLIERLVGPALDRFYGTVRSTPETAKSATPAI